MKKYNVCVVGIGAVGTEIIRLLEKRNFPINSLTILARSEREEIIDGKSYTVKPTSNEAFDGMDFAFFSGTEGSKGASTMFGWEAVRRGCIVIDNGDDFRMHEHVPLVIPEINPEDLEDHVGFIANPNCSTIIALTALAPLHKTHKIRRIIASTYQAVSGSGAQAITELRNQCTSWVKKEPLINQCYPHPILFNVIPAIGSFCEATGESTEEMKMRREAQKILSDGSIKIMTTCVRVPVLNGHSISLNVEFQSPIKANKARDILQQAPGVCVIDYPKENQYPTPQYASGKYQVLVGRIRTDTSAPNSLALWCSGDNIWKGAALNAIQIAEHMIKK